MSEDRLGEGAVEPYLSTAFVGRRIVYKDIVGSTNAVAFDLAGAGCEEGTCVIAEGQTAGRGRLKRQWHSPYGRNIYVSCVLRPAWPPKMAPPLAFVPSLAAFDTVTRAGVEPRLKWPNDVLVGKRKICGTLMELSAEGDRVRFIVVGIGLNVNMAPEDMDEATGKTATSLFMETRNRFERAAVCGMLLNGLERYYREAMDKGPGEVLSTWEDRAAIRGAFMEVRQAERVYRGVAEGLAEDGALLLADSGKVTRVIAGDVSI